MEAGELASKVNEQFAKAVGYATPEALYHLRRRWRAKAWRNRSGGQQVEREHP